MVQQFLKVIMSEELGKQNNYNERYLKAMLFITKSTFYFYIYYIKSKYFFIS